MTNNLEAVRNSWDKTSDSEWYRSLRTDERITAIKENPQTAFHPTVFSVIQKFLPEIKGKHILLPSSGDNHASFAFAVLGAKVTSTDISERQLENAESISKKHGWDIEYICDDTMNLSKLPDDKYDLVYTSNGTHVWINDIESMYRNIYRVLKTSGFSIMYDIHPFTRPFSGEIGEPKIIKPYTDVSQKNHWRIQDLMNAMISANLTIKQIEEMSPINASYWFRYDELVSKSEDELQNANDWRINHMAALPVWLTICSQKLNNLTV
jgi:SAM-dependent methyltransferase